MSLNLNFESARQLCGDALQVMLYGFTDLLTGDVERALIEEARRIRPTSRAIGVFNWIVGDDVNSERNQPSAALTRQTLEGRCMTQTASYDNGRSDKRIFKNGITTLVAENCIRHHQGLPPIQCLFILDSSENMETYNPAQVAQRSGIFTFSEVRRAYKLCFDPDLPPSIRQVAQRTFKFVYLERRLTPLTTSTSLVSSPPALTVSSSNGLSEAPVLSTAPVLPSPIPSTSVPSQPEYEYVLRQIDAPWETPTVANALAERLIAGRSRRNGEGKSRWRESLVSVVDAGIAELNQNSTTASTTSSSSLQTVTTSIPTSTSSQIT